MHSSRIMGSRIYGNEEPRFLWFNHYDRFSVTGFRIDSVYTDKKVANNTKINTYWYTLLIITLLFVLASNNQKSKLEKINGTLIILFYVNPCSPQLQRICFFYLKTQKRTYSSAYDWWEYTNSCFKENPMTFPKNSHLSVFSSKCEKNVDQNNSEYGYFLRSGMFHNFFHFAGFSVVLVYQWFQIIQFQANLTSKDTKVSVFKKRLPNS